MTLSALHALSSIRSTVANTISAVVVKSVMPIAEGANLEVYSAALMAVTALIHSVVIYAEGEALLLPFVSCS